MQNDTSAAPRVSVVIPVYNAALDIPVALASVFEQTWSSYEVIVVDDGSDDRAELEAALAPYRSRIRHLTQTNQGAGAARNAGIRAARGELVAFLDADDLWRPDFLRRQVWFLDAHPGCGLVYADAFVTGETPLAGTTFMETAPSAGPVTLRSLVAQTCNIPLSTVVMRRQPLLDAGLFDASIRRGQDFDLWLRLAARGVGMAYQRTVLAERRVRASGLSGCPVAELQRAVAVLERFGRAPDLPADTRTALRVRIATLVDRMELEQAKARIAEANFAAARLHLQSSRSHPVKTRLALVGLRVAPHLVRRVYLALRPPVIAPTLAQELR
jgi:hypothetical protein